MSKIKFIVGAKSDRGNVKKVNQDNFLYKTGTINNSNFGLFIVCDGVGGLAKGEIASARVVEYFNSWLENELYKLLNDYNCDSNKIKTSICNTLRNANEDLINFSKYNDIQLGTTSTILFILEKKYYIAHVGDSRVYLVDKNIEQLTEDHTYYAKLMRDGDIEKAKKTKRSILTQCIGVKENIDIYIKEDEIKKNSIFLLCSDGFYNKSDRKSLIKINKLKNKKQTKLQKQCEYLIDKVKAKGERDNITLITVSVKLNKFNFINNIKNKFLGGKSK